MPVPALVWGAGAALGIGFAYLFFGNEDYGDTEDEAPGDLPSTPTKTATFTPADPNPVGPSSTPSVGGSAQTGSWDTNLWGTGSNMNWTAIRTAMTIFGWPANVGSITTDINGTSCPGVGIGSRKNCTSNIGLRNFQAGFNRLVDRAGDASSYFIGQHLFAGKPKLDLDGILGKNTLNAMSTAMGWQNQFAGGPFGVDKMRLESIA